MKPQPLALTIASLLIVVRNGLHAQTPAPSAPDSGQKQQAGYLGAAVTVSPAAVPPPGSGTGESATLREPPTYELVLAGDLGISTYNEPESMGGVVVGVSPLARMGVFEFGPYAQLEGTGVFSQSSLTLGLAGGIANRLPRGVQMDILGTLSLHDYSGWGGDTIFRDNPNPGASATLGCVGGRARLFYLFSSSKREHFLLGLQVGFDHDVKRELVHYLDGNHYPAQALVGGNRLTVGLIIGEAFELGPRRAGQ